MGTFCEEHSAMTQFILPEIWKRYAVVLSIHAGSSNTKISQYLAVNQRTVQKIQKDLDESNSDYEGTAAWKPYTDSSDQMRIPGFVSEIQTGIDKYPSKWIRLITRYIDVSEFDIRLVMHEDICFFPMGWERDNFLSQAMKNKKKNYTTNILDKVKLPLQPNMLWVFCQMRKISTRIRWCTYRTKMNLYWGKRNTQ